MSKRADRFTKTARAKREQAKTRECCRDTDCRCKVKPRKARTEGDE